MASAARAARTGSSSWALGQPNTANTASPMNFSRVPSRRSIVSAIPRSAGADARAHLLGIELGDHPDVVDEVREERGDDPPVTDLDRTAGGRPFRATGEPPGARG